MGGLMDRAFEYVIKNQGIDTESSYEYTAKTGKTCNYTAAHKGATISSYKVGCDWSQLRGAHL